MYNTIEDYTAFLGSTCCEIYTYIDVMMLGDFARTFAGRYWAEADARNKVTGTPLLLICPPP